jgi:phasin protein
MVNPINPWSSQMSKRKPAHARASKSKPAHAGGPTKAAKAQRAAEAIVRSPKASHERSARAGTTARPARPEQQGSLLVEKPGTAMEPVTALEEVCKPTMMDSGSKNSANVFSAATKARAYQAKLMEMAQANMQFTFEFAQRLATIRSPIEFPIIIAEFTSKRLAMFRKYSREMAELSTEGWAA